MKILTILVLSLGLLTIQINAKEEANKKAMSIIKEMLEANTLYLKSQSQDEFKMVVEGQDPRITLVSCSDSRVQNSAIDSSPENDLFVIRNIGNQLISNEGSVAYGIKHLKTPILLIMGHSRCGAIKAAMSDYSAENSAIRKEVSTLALSIQNSCERGDPQKWIKNIVNNVHKQVEYSLQEYHNDVDKGTLMIVGAVFDFANDMKHGYGQFNVVNINGEDVEEKFDALKVNVKDKDMIQTASNSK